MVMGARCRAYDRENSRKVKKMLLSFVVYLYKYLQTQNLQSVSDFFLRERFCVSGYVCPGLKPLTCCFTLDLYSLQKVQHSCRKYLC